MKWSDVIADRELQNLPYKIELNEWGNIVMSPASNRHSFLQMAIAMRMTRQKKDGHVFNECSIETSKGVKVADVIWGSSAFFATHKLETPYRAAPEVCVEILSPSNSAEEMIEKKDLYLARGAREVWVCSESGELSFFGNSGQMPTSELFSKFSPIMDVPFDA